MYLFVSQVGRLIQPPCFKESYAIPLVPNLFEYKLAYIASFCDPSWSRKNFLMSTSTSTLKRERQISLYLLLFLSWSRRLSSFRFSSVFATFNSLFELILFSSSVLGISLDVVFVGSTNSSVAMYCTERSISPIEGDKLSPITDFSHGLSFR